MPPTPLTHNFAVAGQITREEIAVLASDGYSTIINNRPDNEEPGQLTHEDAAAEAAKHGMAYVYIPVQTHTITRKDVTDTYHAIERSPNKVLAHCRSGTRCYLLWASARALFNGESPLKLVAEGATKGYDLRVLPALVEKLQAEGNG